MMKATAIAASAKVIIPPLIPAYMLAENIINEATAIPLTIAAAVGGACWYLNGRFTRIEAVQESQNKTLERLEEKLDSRPCGIAESCPQPPPWQHKNKHH